MPSIFRPRPEPANESWTSPPLAGVPFHLKNGIRADLPAHATTVTDSAERAAVIAAIVDDLNQPHDPGTVRPTQLDDWAASRLMRIDFD